MASRHQLICTLMFISGYFLVTFYLISQLDFLSACQQCQIHDIISFALKHFGITLTSPTLGAY